MYSARPPLLRKGHEIKEHDARRRNVYNIVYINSIFDNVGLRSWKSVFRTMQHPL
jgi:hypothetical protein